MANWILKIYDQDGKHGGSLLSTIDSTTYTNPSVTPFPIDGGFEIETIPPGEPVSMKFRGRNDLLQIQVRYVLEVIEDSTQLFYGPVVQCPFLDSVGAGPLDSDADALELFICEGPRRLAKESYVSNYFREEYMHVGVIALQLGAFLHPAILVDSLNFELSDVPTTVANQVRYDYVRQGEDVDTAIKALADEFDYDYWYDAEGIVYFTKVV